jgi:preprotein translocase subunit SecY
MVKQKGYWFNFDMFTGGAFSKASVFALGLCLTASIVVQLMGIAIPYLQNFKVMESGRKKINQITRWLTIDYFSSRTNLHL